MDKDSSPIQRTATNILLNNLDGRYPITINMVLAAYLDPTIKHLPIIKDFVVEKMENLTDCLKSKWVEFGLTMPMSNVNPNTLSKPPNRKAVTIIRIELIERYSQSSSTPLTIEDHLKIETEKYALVSTETHDLLKWLNENKENVPYLRRLVQ